MQYINFNFVLLDLPFRSATELLTEIKQRFPAVKVVMFTNNTEFAYRSICMQLGADYFFDKSSEFKILEDELMKEYTLAIAS